MGDDNDDVDDVADVDSTAFWMIMPKRRVIMALQNINRNNKYMKTIIRSFDS